MRAGGPLDAASTADEQPAQAREASSRSYTAPDAQPAVSAATTRPTPTTAAPTPPRAARCSFPILDAEYTLLDRLCLPLSITHMISSFNAPPLGLSAPWIRVRSCMAPHPGALTAGAGRATGTR